MMKYDPSKKSLNILTFFFNIKGKKLKVSSSMNENRFKEIREYWFLYWKNYLLKNTGNKGAFSISKPFI